MSNDMAPFSITDPFSACFDVFNTSSGKKTHHPPMFPDYMEHFPDFYKVGGSLPLINGVKITPIYRWLHKWVTGVI